MVIFMVVDRTKIPKQAVILFNKLQSKGKFIFTLNDANDLIDISRDSLKNLLSRLFKSNWVKRLEREKYLIVPFEAGIEGRWSVEPFIIASQLVEPYAIAYWSAMSHWGYTEQIVRTIFVLTTMKKNKMQFEILGIPYHFIKTSSDKFFGVTQIWVSNKKITITDKERTLIGAMDKPELCGGFVESSKVLKTGFEKNEFSIKKIIDYGTKLRNNTIFKRIGYLLDFYKIDQPELRLFCQRKLSKGYPRLDPAGNTKGKYNKEWMILDNVSKSDLNNWIEY